MPLKKDKPNADISFIPWEKCVAKSLEDGSPGLTVAEHCRNVAEVTKALLKIIPEPVLYLMGGAPATTAALHDIGKVSPGFQKKICGTHLSHSYPQLAKLSLCGFETKHATISEAALNAFLGARSETDSRLAAVVGAHHGIRDGSYFLSDIGSIFGGESWAHERRALIEQMIREYGALRETPTPDLDLLTGLICVADWIGSDEAFFPPDGLPAGIDRSERARKALAASGWEPIKIEPGLSFKDIFDFPPYPVQCDFIETIKEPGLYVIEAPMGLGKTEAALYAAYRLMSKGHNCGLYFGLPTRLTSDRIHERVLNFIQRVTQGREKVRLAHGQAWLKAFNSGGEELGAGKSWFQPSKRALLMPFAVGTIDQALFSVLKVRHHFIRSFGLAGKVVVLDEVHSYDVYTGTLLDLLVRRLLEIGCTVIILSATLTKARKVKFFNKSTETSADDTYPLITFENRSIMSMKSSALPDSKSVQISMSALSDNQLAEISVGRAQTGHCVLCIANTVARAQQWYGEIKAIMPENAFNVALLHSAFPAWRREELETHWMKRLGVDGNRAKGCVLVATQVVEQSVDIDADYMISEIAPTDMLLQRLGRLWRHDRPNRPCRMPSLKIITGNISEICTMDELENLLGGPNCRVYQPYVLWRTYQIWHQRSEVWLPKDIRGLLEETYTDLEDDPEFIKEAKTRLIRRREKLEALAQTVRSDKIGFCTLTDDERAATRYSELPKIDAVLAKMVDSDGIKASLELSDGKTIEVDAFKKNPYVTAKLHMNKVAVPLYMFLRVKTPRYLQKHFFENTLLLTISADGGLMHDGKPTPLRYDNLRGIQQKSSIKQESPSADWKKLTQLEKSDEWEGGLDEFGW